MSLLESADRTEIHRDWENLVDAVDERRKFAVDRGGLCLLAAYVLEGIQRRAGWVMAYPLTAIDRLDASRDPWPRRGPARMMDVSHAPEALGERTVRTSASRACRAVRP